MKIGDKEKERQTQETAEELMNGKVMGEVEDTFLFRRVGRRQSIHC